MFCFFMKNKEVLRELVKKANVDVKFCHNDLNNKNIFLLGEKILLIDFEYSAYNPVSYDIANFLNEQTINYDYPDFPHFSTIGDVSTEFIQKAVSYYPASK